jgi:CDP-6-deoxy-D-xylo-4-hexulose-3-dehydrase
MDKRIIHYAGRVFDHEEKEMLQKACDEMWLTQGRYTKQFEKGLSDFLGIKYVHFCNSGSSANLLAFMALTSPLLKERRIKRGDEVITVACCFPTTVTPILQYGAIPVFVDIELNSVNIDISQLEKALSNKTKAVMIAHTLGNPFNIEKIVEFCKKNNLYLIEDNCDSLGSKHKNQYTGTFGDIATSSFYPAHHVTTGEGGAIYTNDALLSRIILSMRDWGRDCQCEGGTDNKCGKRFNTQHGDLPFGWDHKYTYFSAGYNLKATDLQASIGVAQLKKLKSFIEDRRLNWLQLYLTLGELNNYFMFQRSDLQALPSWFGFLLTLKEGGSFTRNDIVEYLEDNGIQTRMLFAGNIIKQPLFTELKENKDYKVIGNLNNTNYIMNNSFWIGVYPGLSPEDIEYMIYYIKKFVSMHP